MDKSNKKSSNFLRRVTNANCHIVRTRQTRKIAVFWIVAPCSLVEVYQRFRGPCCLHHQGDALRTSNLTKTNQIVVRADSCAATKEVRCCSVTGWLNYHRLRRLSVRFSSTQMLVSITFPCTPRLPNEILSWEINTQSVVVWKSERWGTSIKEEFITDMW
jgi:hypothetical protein